MSTKYAHPSSVVRSSRGRNEAPVSDGRLSRDHDPGPGANINRLAHQRNRRAMRDPDDLRFYGSGDWQRLRREVLADAGYTCEARTLPDGQMCDEPCNTAGHIVPWRLLPDLGLERDNVRAECRRHQRQAHLRAPGVLLPR
jgi:hypothetical protein